MMWTRSALDRNPVAVNSDALRAIAAQMFAVLVDWKALN
jgi:hypothetical protein